jgi:hypothetical protein
MSRTRAYTIWCSMMGRCRNPNNDAYANYGGRGISVCQRWSLFEDFYADMGEPADSQSIDRIDNDGDYSPQNCRWASRTEQNRNRRNVRLLTVDGETASMAEWADRSGIDLRTIWLRLKKGWSDDAAVKTPVVRDRKGKPRGYRWAATEDLVIEHFDGPQAEAA